MTKEELERRRPVWSAMSDLFLDTEVRWSVPFVARRCAESGYDDETLERIFWGEVFPEAIHNLKGVAGEWATLELDEAALVRRANRPSIPWLTRRADGDLVQGPWKGAREVTKWLRELAPEERVRRALALDALGKRYFEEPSRELGEPWAALFVNERALLTELWARYEPLCRDMEVGEGDPTADAHAAAVRALLA